MFATPKIRSRRPAPVAVRRNLFLESLEDRRVFATGTLAFSNAAYTYTEGSGGGSFTGQLVYTGETTTAAGTATVDLTAGTATAADFTTTPISVNIPAGTTTGATIDFTLPVTNDTLLEGTENLTAQLGTITAGAGDTITASGITNTTLTINDNETATLNFANPTLSVNEADGTVNVNANLVITANGTANTGTLANPLTVNFTSNAGSDLTINSVTIPAGTASGTIQIPIQITDNNTANGDQTFNVSVDTVTGGGTVTGGNTLALTVVDNDTVNAAPVVNVSGPTSIQVGKLATFTITTTDVPADVTAGFTYNIDFGDGTTKTVTGDDSILVTHKFATKGNFTVTVTATDQNNDVSQEATADINVKAAAFVIVNGQLRVTGTAGNDNIVVTAAANGKYTVRLNGSLLGTFAAKRLLIKARAGDDNVILRGSAAGKLHVRAVVLAGTGDDTVNATGNVSGNIVVGGAGTDSLIGSAGRDILLGGAGRDTLRGLGGQDILVGGGLRFEARAALLDSILADWRGSGTFRSRINAIRTGAGTNITLNSVVDDHVRDHLFGGPALDLLIAGAADTTDFVRGDILVRDTN